MGVLNITPDSFSDGGRYASPDAALERALRMAEEGADILDIGGESTRPGSEPVPEDEQIRRVVPVIRALAGRIPAAISIDTSRARVARAAIEAGAEIINDVAALAADPDMPAAAASADCGVVLMHMRGSPATMQNSPAYGDIVEELAMFFAGRVEAAARAGVDPERVALDPGIGFGKTFDHNLELLAGLPRLCGTALNPLGRPMLVGLSRKSFLRRLIGEPNAPVQTEAWERLVPANVAAATAAVLRGARVVRVHDVAATVRAMRVAEALI